ncbi:hypothetical protein M9980_13085 [Sphingomonas donggukensis]|uniref:Uncharacterized protein n=1 Tax=Sphingomonas donggukensis TaxID=2949093 RepID=A0ABY4TSR3_9SPHN|nr:hypothetical protein [Sphingomonas donggukensis]URW75450.1 hypothetical protein M9980_13085 [Sphingomonas donggukensis]
MTARIEARVRRVAGAAVARARERVAAALAGVPGVAVEIGEDGVAVSGRRLKARWLNDARLRWLGDRL